MQGSQHYPSVAIVILNWNGRKYLEKFLPAVEDTSYENFSIVVADNHSADDSIAFLKTHHPQVGLIALDKNYGFAEGYNRALSQLDADYFVLLNSDVTVTKEWLHPLVSLMLSNSNIAACQPKILSYKHKTQFEYAGAAGGWIDRLGYPFCRGRVLGYCEEDTGQYDDVSEVFWASGACLMVRPAIFKKMGGFDTFFFAHQEEIDLCWRMKNAGYQIYVHPGSVVYHVGGGSLAMGDKKKVFLNYRNNLVMLYKNLPATERRRTLFLRMLLDGVAALQFLLLGRGGSFMAVARAHIGYYKWKKIAGANPDAGNAKPKDLPGVFGGSIVINFFLKGKKTFAAIVENKK